MKERKKRNFIWSIPLEDFKLACKKAKTISDVIKPYGVRIDGRNTHTVIARAKKENIDISHIPLGLGANKGRPVTFSKKPLGDILKEHSKINRYNIKSRLIREKVLENVCAICGLQELWNGKPIVLVLDHINGINDDYRLENLRLVCPNCNSQLPTFAGRNTRKAKVGQTKCFCIDCGKEVHKGSSRCPNCYIKNRYY